MAKPRSHEDDPFEDAPTEDQAPKEEKLDEFRTELKAKADAQGSDDGQQDVPETRPQAFTQPGSGTRSRTDLATKREPAMGEAEYKAAESTPENEAAAAEAGRVARLIEGQRVQIVSGQYTGRMAYIMGVDYTDPTQALIAASGGSEARFADVADYIVRTRDGRAEVLTVTPDEVEPLEVNNGWGRGSI